MENTQRFKLGLFVIAAFALLIAGLYYIGSKKSIFHSTINASSSFNNVNGLLTGNNVRFNGINIGTVSAITAESDSSVRVDFTIEKDAIRFISVKAVASIGTDGLLGNKLVNIQSSQYGARVREGSRLYGLPTLNLDPTMRNLSATGQNTFEISEEIRQIATKLNRSESLWKLLNDSLLGANLKSTISRFHEVGSDAALIAENINGIVASVKKGEGSVGQLLMQDELSTQLSQTLATYRATGDSLRATANKIARITATIENGAGPVGMLLNDSLVEQQVRSSISKAERSIDKFEASMDAIQQSWLLKSYFKKNDDKKQTKEPKQP